MRADLLDTYDGRLRAALDAVAQAAGSGFDARRGRGRVGAGRATGGSSRPAYRAQRGPRRRRRPIAPSARSFATPVAAGVAARSLVPARARCSRASAPRRSSDAEQLRRAGQLLRFPSSCRSSTAAASRTARVVLDFEIQEAITFRDGAAAAFADLESILLARDAAATRRIGAAIDDARRRRSPPRARGDAVATPTRSRRRPTRRSTSPSGLFPTEWKDAAKTADFDVISATLDRVQAAAAQGDWGRAEQARLEAYGVFELGPEQRLRGLAPGHVPEGRRALLVRRAATSTGSCS